MTTATGAGLDRSLARGIAWTGGVKWITSLMTWGITLATARLLTPEDYGVMGMAVVVIGFAQLISDVGLNATIIQTPDLTERLASRLGGAAIMIAVGITALTIGSAALLAEFFREPTVRWIITGLSATFILRGVQVLRRSLLTRTLQFKRLAVIEGLEAVVMAVTALVFAALGFRYWSLVIGVITGATASTVACLVLYPHTLRFPRQVAELDGTLKFGAQVAGGQVAWYLYSTADMIVVGRMLGTAALGAYTLAWVLASIAVERIAALMGRVTPAIFSAVQRNPAALRRYVYSLTEGLALITMPICIGIALSADLIVRVALGNAWIAAIAPMRLLAIYASVRCISVILPQLMVYTGRAKQSMQFNLIALGVLLPLFILGASWGQTTGVAWAWVVAFPLLTAATYLRHLRRAIALSATDYLRALWPAVSATLVMVAVVLTVRTAWAGQAQYVWELIAVVGSGAAAYSAVAYLLYKQRFIAVVRLLRTPPPADDQTEQKVVVAPRGRLLLISYHFPPDPAIGSLRWQKFARHAADRGWGLDVIMRDDASIATPDLERLTDLPPGVRRIGVATRPFWFEGLEARLAKIYRLVMPRGTVDESVAVASLAPTTDGRGLLRAYFSYIGHLRQRRWAADAAAAARAIIEADVHRCVIGCGPPYSGCIAGRMVARTTGLPLVIDLRDPWSLIQRVPESTASPLNLKLRRLEERKTMAASSMVVMNSAPIGAAMRGLYPETRIIHVANGFDDETMPATVERKRFIIAYAGTVYLDRDPRSLFDALARVVATLGLNPTEIGIEFMGAVERTDGVSLEERAEAAGVGAFVHVHAIRPRSEAMQFLASASMLVMLPQDADMVIPGKVYEYMRFDSWMLVLAEPQSATALLLRGTSAHVVSAQDIDGLEAAIAQRYLQFVAGERAVPIAEDMRFSRSARAAEFFDALDSVLAPVSVGATTRTTAAVDGRSRAAREVDRANGRSPHATR